MNHHHHRRLSQVILHRERRRSNHHRQNPVSHDRIHSCLSQHMARNFFHLPAFNKTLVASATFRVTFEPFRPLDLSPFPLSSYFLTYHAAVSPRISFAGPSHLPYQSTDDLPLLSQSPSTHSTQPGYRDSPQCPSFDEPILSNTPPKMAPSAPDRHAWEAREGEYILIDIASDQYESYRPEKQNPYKMRRCDLRIFELVNATYYISTRRLAVRSREHEEQCVSYCKS